MKKAIAYCTRISQVNGPLSSQYDDAAERLRTRARIYPELKVKVVGHDCRFCSRQAEWLMPSSEDQGKTVTWTPCCMDCAAGWWDGADWDGSALDAVFVRKKY